MSKGEVSSGDRQIHTEKRPCRREGFLINHNLDRKRWPLWRLIHG